MLGYRGALRLTNEADEVVYFAVDDMPDNALPKQLERIYDAVALIPEVILKAQVGPSSTAGLK